MATGKGKPSDILRLISSAPLPNLQVKPDKPWPYQNQFDRFMAHEPAVRVRDDRRALKKVFNEAAKTSPTFRRELQWAKKSGVKFFVDHQCRGVLGYYTYGTGAVGVAASLLSGSVARIASTLAHEIRHARQDAEGLCPERAGFVNDYRGLCLIEADATAHEQTVLEEVIRGRHEKITKKTTMGLLWANFKGWYDSDRPRIYGVELARRAAQRFMVKGMTPKNYNYAFRAFSMPVGFFSIDDKASVARLGVAFNGANYFKAPDAEAFFAMTGDRKLAKKFYDTKRKGAPKLVQQVCSAEKKRLKYF